ncbi:MAG: hypothetical protein QM612_10140 [Thermomonas sp.]|uniref:hypothetical protein n=1 Tax=Thermomonas sp. TaxID=1971895 RepID=UPI0039E6E16C
MTTANDVIAALNQRRLLKTGRLDDAGRMPAGWQQWFDGMPRVDAQAAHARPASWIDVFVQRPLRPIPRRPGAKSRLQAFFSLLQQNWEPDPRDERGLRIGVTVLDIVMHLVLVALLLWLMYLGMVALSKVEEDDEAVQVEFIGRGNAEEGGGALAAAGAESAASPAPAVRQPTPSPSPATEAAATAQPANVAEQPVPAPSAEVAAAQPEPAPQPVEDAAQELQVSEVRVPDPASFQLPPPRERSTTLPELRERAPRQTEVVDVEAPRMQALPERQVAVRQPQPREPQLRQRALPVDAIQPDPTEALRQRPLPGVSEVQVQARAPELRARAIVPKPGGSPTTATKPGSGNAASGSATSGAGNAHGDAPAAGQAKAGAGQGARAATESGRGVTTVGSGAGPGLKPAPGGWSGAAKSDDWGASDRNVAGTGNGGKSGDGKSGLFNSDGSTRLPDEWTKQSGIDIDRAGTWLKRPGLEYKGTRFDKYWIPNGTLLEEWVRRGIKKVAIPIPGSKLQLRCAVSALPPGAVCTPYNPDVNEQPAIARPPPDVPFKPELQEDNGSVRPADPPAGG